MTRSVSKVGGHRTTSGYKEPRRGHDGLPTLKETRVLNQQMGGNSRRGRCGRPGRIDSPEFWARVAAKLSAAARSGRGLRFLSRDELDAVNRRLAMVSLMPKPKGKTL